MKGLIDVAMIARDEARSLPLALRSIAALGDLVAHVHLYDTGSQDDTVAIAQAQGAHVEAGYWDDDFARARNAALDACDAPFALILDADECIQVPDPAALRDALTQSDADVLAVTITNIDAAGQPASSFAQARLLRRGAARYAGRLHEQLVGMDGAPAQGDASLVGVVDLQHSGYADPAAMVGKAARNVRCATAGLAALGDGAELTDDAEASRVDLLVDRARAYRSAGDIELAVADLVAVRDAVVITDKTWLGLEVLAELLMDLGRFAEAADVIAELNDASPAPTYAAWLSAVCLAAVGQAQDALAVLRGLETLTSASGIAYSPSRVYEARADLAAELGESAEALSSLLTAMLGCGSIAGNGSRLLSLWGDQPLAALARILWTEGAGRRGELIDELRACGRHGQRLASLMKPSLARG